MTINELAKLADVSVATVSKIMNNKIDDISPSTREKVLKIAEQYNYSPYSKAISKAFPKSKLIGIIVPDIAVTIYSSIIKYLDHAVSEKGYALIVNGLGEDGKINLDLLVSKRVECVVAFDTAFDATDKAKLSDYNTAFLSYQLTMLKEDDEHLLVNISKAIGQGISYLTERGFNQVAFFTTHGHECVKRIFQSEMENNEVIFDSSLIFEIDCQESQFADSMEVFLNTGVKAALVENTYLAKQIYQYAFSKKIIIPDDLSLIAFDFQGNANEFIPLLCSYQLPYKEIAYYVERSAFSLIQNSPKQIENQEIDLLFQKGESVCDNIVGRKAGISVVGSINMDITFRVDSILKSSETMLIRDRTILPGGKAANQAIGVVRMGGNASIISVLGNDMNGKNLYNNLVENNVDVTGVEFENAATTGVAYVFVSSTAEYLIGDYPGTSCYIDKKYIDKHTDIIRASKYCLIQTGIPVDTITYVSQICQKYEVDLILKPSSVKELEDSILFDLFMIVPNKTEINQIISGDMSEQEKADLLVQKGVKNVVLTMGDEGCYFTNGKIKKSYPAIDLVPIDTTGASDAFISALAVFLAEENTLDEAITLANTVAGISTTRLGAQSSIPDRYTLNLYHTQKKDR